LFKICGLIFDKGFFALKVASGESSSSSEIKGVEKNAATAVHWYTKAAEQGYLQAQSNLGFCFEKGTGVKQNYKNAVRWYSKAAAQGDALAQYNLGICFEKGDGVHQDSTEAKRYFKLAAEQGFTPAIAKLAALSRKGPDADLVESNRLLRKAKRAVAKGGDKILQQFAQKLVNNELSNLGCSKPGCSFSLSSDLTEDARKKGKMKVCARCHQAQYCSKPCQSFIVCLHFSFIFFLVLLLSCYIFAFACLWRRQARQITGTRATGRSASCCGSRLAKPFL